MFAAISTQGEANSVITITEQWNPIWESILSGGTTIFSVLSNVGLLFCAIGFFIWGIRTFRAFVQGDNYRGWTSLVLPLIVVLFLVNNGSLLRDFIFLQRNIINGVNAEILSSLNANYQFRTVLSGNQGEGYVNVPGNSILVNVTDISESQQRVQALLRSLRSAFDNCGKVVGTAKVQCFENIFAENSNYHPNSSAVLSLNLVPNHYAVYINQFLFLKRQSENIIQQISTPDGEGLLGFISDFASRLNPLGLLSSLSSAYENYFIFVLNTILSAMQIAFTHLSELALLLTALLAPLALGASLLTTEGTLGPFLGWIAGFWGIGLSKIALTICQSVSQLLGAMAQGNLANEMTFYTISLLTAVFSPILAFALASGGGLSIYSSVAQVFMFFLSLR